MYDINKGHGVWCPPYLLGDKGYSFMNWKMDTTQLKSCCTIKKTQMGPLCRKKCFWNSKNNFQGIVFQIKIECGFHTWHLYILLFLAFHLLGIKDEMSIEHLLHIIKLEASGFHEENLSIKFQHYARWANKSIEHGKRKEVWRCSMKGIYSLSWQIEEFTWIKSWL
jgi:hypothetical protein